MPLDNDLIKVYGISQNQLVCEDSCSRVAMATHIHQLLKLDFTLFTLQPSQEN